MKVEDFTKLLKLATENTKNVKGYAEWRSTGVCQVPDEVAAKIDCMVALLQDKIANFCKKDEYLMIYNFQPICSQSDDSTDTSSCLFSLEIVIRPTSKISDLTTCDGKALQLIVDGNTGIIADDTYALMGLFDDDETAETPVCYGNYLDYLEPKTPKTPEGRDPKSEFRKQLMALQSMSFAYPELYGETKSERESQSPTYTGISRNFIDQPRPEITFAYDSRFELVSPTSNPIPLVAFSKISGSASSLLCCKA